MKPPVLSEPLKYFPVSRNDFEFKAGLARLDLNSDEPRQYFFQLDKQWPAYRKEKLTARAERLQKYVCQDNLNPEIRAQASAFIIVQLCHHYPSLFQLQRDTLQASLNCVLSGETLVFDDQLELFAVENSAAAPPYQDNLDALCCQIQEDISISEMGGQRDRISYLHLCLPNYWAAEDKIGRSFIDAHRPVPAMEKINTQASSLMKTLCQKGPFERFTWGITSDTRLNHHPQAPADQPQDSWLGRHAGANEYFLRIERQAMMGFSKVTGLLFSIRTYHRPFSDLNGDERRRLARSIQSMPPEVLEYKGLKQSKENILALLNEV